MKRQKLLERKRYTVTSQDIVNKWVIDEANSIGGPQIKRDEVRGFGLFAEKDYQPNEKITEYGGVLHNREVQGDYVAFVGDGVHIDGRIGFRLDEKGRWINESDSDRSVVNVKLGRDIRALYEIKKGDQIFADYGEEYIRNY